ncbi:MAG TPA: hypothetical protein VFU82_03695 [Gammaproteobacteria bacterium]|nr:hypothetical protein [Gammaproteobacteria bacterium]
MKKTAWMLERGLFCGFLALPVIYTILYLMRTNQLPQNDAANYLYTAVDIYKSFVGHHLFHGLKGFYDIRGWRPIFFPNLSVPFLLASGGNLFVAYWGVSLLCISVTVFYVYLYFRLLLDRLPACIATSLICLLPYVQAQIVMFYAEAALFPLIIGSVYHLIQSDYLRVSKHTYAFIAFTGLALMVRPIEAVTHLMFILALFVAIGCRGGVFSISDILKTVLIALFGVFLFSASAIMPYRHGYVVPVADNGGPLDQKMEKFAHVLFTGSGLVFLAMLVLVGVFYLKRNPQAVKKNNLVASLTGILIIVLLWYLPHGFDTFQWIYRTSLGDVATSTGSLSGSQFSLSVLGIYLGDEGWFVVAGVVAAALFGLISMNGRRMFHLLTALPLIYLTLMSPFPVWEAFYTVQIVTRKLSIVFPALLMVMLFIALQRSKWFSFRLVFVAIIGLVQSFLLISALYIQNYPHRFSSLMLAIGDFIAQPSVIQPNPHEVAIQFFDNYENALAIKSIGLEVIPGTPDARHPVEAEPINPFLLSLMLSASTRPYYANYLYFGVYDRNNVRAIQKQYKTIFLSDQQEAMQISKKSADVYLLKFQQESNPSLKTFYEFMYHYSNNTLSAIGWKLGPCIFMDTQAHGRYRACLLVALE